MSRNHAAVAALFIWVSSAGPLSADDSSHWRVPAAPPADLWVKAKPKLKEAPAGAQPSPNVQRSLQVSAASDVVFRGQSLTSGHGSLQTGFAASYSPTKKVSFAGGAFAGQKYDDGQLNRPVYGYWASAAEDSRFGLLTMNAFYFDISNDDDVLSVEFGNEVFHEVAKGLTLNASFAAAPASLSTFGDMLYVKAGFELAPSPKTLGWTLRGHIGRQWIEDNADYGTPDYTEGEVSFSRTWLDIDMAISVTATDTARKDCFDGSHDCDPRLALTLAHAFAL